MAIELSKRSKDAINSYSVHPGLIHTNLNQTHAGIFGMQRISSLTPMGTSTRKIGRCAGRGNNGRRRIRSVDKWCALCICEFFPIFIPLRPDKPGAYLSDCIVTNETIPCHGSDPVNAKTLWKVTEKIIEETFSF
ncbi:hypothetical protein B0H16DRAFT_1850256 [Mycena metata]|uniref:Uncharacterized protein n=1 Tax=Mycena metata TaxID=1033252 RepID=A0AAD7HKP6_9AGAR|nr:hypothetical protein B0H16DRAFT_1788516 [Mycena metata]KAJ7747777.1 hypothetical protein B0H16DRAFT_1850256 [Mycena metata]